MWQQFLRVPGLRAVTSTQATTIKLAATHRDSMDAKARGAEVRGWWTSMHEPGFRDGWDERVRQAVRRAAIDGVLNTADLQVRTASLQDRAASLDGEVESLTRDVSRLEAECRDVRELLSEEARRAETAENTAVETQHTIDQILASRSWRLTAPLRSLRGR